MRNGFDVANRLVRTETIKCWGVNTTDSGKVIWIRAEEKGDRGYGMIYEVVMDITGPNKKTAKVLTAWINDKNNGEMRLTTVHVDK